MKDLPRISIIIRTKNEAKWLGRCLRATTLQDYPYKEIVVVDNASTDETPEILERFDCRTVHISVREFTFGRAINWGIQASTGDLLVCLSAHCIPVHNKWLDRLLVNFNQPDVAAVYGRQEPLPDSHPFDKRDLWNVFSIDRKVQTKDSFFHNANAMLRHDIWERIPFDERLNGVEDRDWAKKVIENGFRIVYEPSASVYHHHGIHQTMDVVRAERVVRMIELINGREPPSSAPLPSRPRSGYGNR